MNSSPLDNSTNLRGDEPWMRKTTPRRRCARKTPCWALGTALAFVLRRNDGSQSSGPRCIDWLGTRILLNWFARNGFSWSDQTRRKTWPCRPFPGGTVSVQARVDSVDVIDRGQSTMSTRSRKRSERIETGYRVFNDATEALRQKYGRAKNRRFRLTKCPVCHRDIRNDELPDHRVRCKTIGDGGPPTSYYIQFPRNGAAASESSKGKKSSSRGKKRQKSWKCYLCGVTVPDTKRRSHMNRAHEYCACKICGASVRRQNLKEHLARVHSVEKTSGPNSAGIKKGSEKLASEPDLPNGVKAAIRKKPSLQELFS